ncbi:MAG: DUF2312 domain-containing protein [Sphingopyxis terrae]|nr:DUF2312 domain-containing protein [Sphingopyxis terrae]
MSEATVSDNQLRLLIERIERLEEEKKGLAADVRDVYLEAKSQGYDPKIMRQVIRLRKMPAHDRKEMEAVLDVYLSALGMQASFDFDTAA